MDLKVIRGYLDVLDNALMYILLQRMAIIPLVAETKIEQGMPFFQPNREEQKHESLKAFADDVGLNPEFLVEVYKNIASESCKIQYKLEGEPIIYQQSEKAELSYKALSDSLDNANVELKKFLDSMKEIETDTLQKFGKEKSFSQIITHYYRNKIYDSDKE